MHFECAAVCGVSSDKERIFNDFLIALDGTADDVCVMSGKARQC